MALLLPLIIPQLVDATVNLGIGISNAIQGDSSSVSLQIGSKVFTSKKKFNFGSLPPELREEIILMAMEESKELILPTPYFFDPTQPLTKEQLQNIQRHHPLHPESKHYRSIVGDRISANGYPISTWRWASVCREWRDIVRRPLWTNLEVLGYRPYTNLCDRIDSKAGLEVLQHVQTITLREGFRSPSDIYAILSNPIMTDLESISILPDYPTSFDPLVSSVPAFAFGLQLVRTQKRIKSLAFGMPLEMTTNPSSRQHLKWLKPPKLEISLSRPTVALFRELRDLVADTTDQLGIRYIPLRTLAGPETLLCTELQSFKKVNLYLHLPRPQLVMVGPPEAQTLGEDPELPITRFITSLLNALEAANADVQKRYSVWKVEGWETAGQVANATRTRIWPTAVLFDHEFDFDSNAPTPDKEVPPSEPVEPEPKVVKRNNEANYWERETNLRLFGGLFNLSLESKRHGARNGSASPSVVTARSLFKEEFGKISQESLAEPLGKYQPNTAEEGCNVSTGYTIGLQRQAVFVDSSTNRSYPGSEYVRLAARPVKSLWRPLTISEPYILPVEPTMQDVLQMFTDCTALADYPLIRIDDHLPSLTLKQEGLVVPVVQGQNPPRHMQFSLTSGREIHGQNDVAYFHSGAVQPTTDGTV